MISECSTVPPVAPVLWITGLSGVGKSTLASAIAVELRHHGIRPFLIDGDEIRQTLEGSASPVSHDLSSRYQRAWRIARLARMCASQGIPVIVATISLFHSVQAWNRDANVPYAEIWLRADELMLHQRKPELYGLSRDMPHPNVVGLDLPAEFPIAAELVLEQTFQANQMPIHLAQAMELWQRLNSSSHE